MFDRSPSRSRSGSGSGSRFRSLSRSLSGFRSRSRSRPRSRSRSRRESEGASMMMRIDCPNHESRAAFERKFAKLNRVYHHLIKLKRRIKKKVDKMGDKIDWMGDVMDEFNRADTLPTALIHFVHLLDKANLYFEFKTCATRTLNFEHSRTPASIYSLLIHDQKLMSDFKNIEASDIRMAAYAIYREPICKLTLQQYDWIYRLVSRARQGDYVMDQDPEVELKKMMKSVPDLYDSYFLIKRLPAKYKEISKREAYEKYSELVSIINSRSRDALKEKKSAREGEAFDENHHVSGARNFPKTKEGLGKQERLVASGPPSGGLF